MKIIITVCLLFIGTINNSLANNSLANKKITVMLAWFMNPNYANFVIAQKKGFFKENGLNVELIEPTNPSDAPKLLATKKIDYALGHQPSLQMQAVKKWNISRIATMVNAQLNSIVYLKKSGIKNIQDLKGKTIGFSIAGFDDILLKKVLKKGNLSLSDVKLVNINWAIASSLLTGNVDAVIGAYRTFEQLEIELKGFETGAFYLEEYGVPMYDEIIMLAHNDNLNTKQTCLIIDAIEKSAHYIRNHPQESWEIFKSYNPEVLDDKLNYQSWLLMANRFSLSPSALDIGRYNKMKVFLEKNELVDSIIPPINEYAVNPFEKGCK